MSISYSPTPAALCVEIKPSNYLRAALIGIALAAFCAIFYADLTWPLRALLAVATSVYGFHCWHSQTKQRGVLQWQSGWRWIGADSSERRLQLQHSTVWPTLIVLRFDDSERRESFVLTLCADSFVGSDDARRLRVYLNHFPVFAADQLSE